VPVFFISADRIRDRLVTITGPLHHHLRTSMRYRAGDELWVGDDSRKRYRLKVRHVDARELSGEVLEEVTGPPAPIRQLVLGQALLKGERMDWVIQKATELGIDRVVPLVTSNTVVRPKAGRLDAQQERWQRIAREAAQQSERWDVPIVEPLRQALTFFQPPASAAVRLLLVEPGGSAQERQEGLPSVSLGDRDSGPIVLAIGPEGGWRAEELATASDCAFRNVTLGRRVLRAETATVAALAVLQSRLGELG
jgi:16S rRNA (uracil1498-N3)-methyltransferase